MRSEARSAGKGRAYAGPVHAADRWHRYSGGRSRSGPQCWAARDAPRQDRATAAGKGCTSRPLVVPQSWAVSASHCASKRGQLFIAEGRMRGSAGSKASASETAACRDSTMASLLDLATLLARAIGDLNRGHRLPAAFSWRPEVRAIATSPVGRPAMESCCNCKRCLLQRGVSLRSNDSCS